VGGYTPRARRMRPVIHLTHRGGLGCLTLFHRHSLLTWRRTTWRRASAAKLRLRFGYLCVEDPFGNRLEVVEAHDHG
jgi:hypothetical protein